MAPPKERRSRKCLREADGGCENDREFAVEEANAAVVDG